jgi:hypothetical protein
VPPDVDAVDVVFGPQVHLPPALWVAGVSADAVVRVRKVHTCVAVGRVAGRALIWVSRRLSIGLAHRHVVCGHKQDIIFELELLGG